MRKTCDFTLSPQDLAQYTARPPTARQSEAKAKGGERKKQQKLLFNHRRFAASHLQSLAAGAEVKYDKKITRKPNSDRAASVC